MIKDQSFHPLMTSSLAHIALLAFILLLSRYSWETEKQIIQIRVIEAPQQALENQTPVMPPPITLEKPVARPEVKKREVFGVSRRALTSNSSSAPQVKQGNTVVKESDDLKLLDSDADSLPIPQPEYLVSAMPSLKSKPLIQYPAKAKEIGLEGSVVLDVLIDEKGKVREAVVVEGLSQEMDAEALRAIKLHEFSPAMIEDQAVAVRIRYAIKFVLED